MGYKEELKSIMFGAMVSIGYVIITSAYRSWSKKKSRVEPPDVDSKEWQYVGQLSNLIMYPLKSGKGVDVKRAKTTRLGLEQIDTQCLPLRDRFFMVYREDNGEMITSRVNPKLLQCSLMAESETSVKLSYPHKRDLVVKLPSENSRTTTKMWRDESVAGLDCGEEASQWITDALNDFSLPDNEKTKMRLVYWPPGDEATRHLVESWPDLKQHFVDVSNVDGGAFSDFSSYLLLISSSVDEVNRRLQIETKSSDIAISYRNFRPNFFVQSDQPPFSDLNWSWVKINNIVFRWVKGCKRCILTTLDPDTGVKLPNNQPLAILNKMNEAKVSAPIEESPMMGIHLSWYKDGVISQGDSVFAIECSHDRH